MMSEDFEPLLNNYESYLPYGYQMIDAIKYNYLLSRKYSFHELTGVLYSIRNREGWIPQSNGIKGIASYLAYDNIDFELTDDMLKELPYFVEPHGDYHLDTTFLKKCTQLTHLYYWDNVDDIDKPLVRLAPLASLPQLQYLTLHRTKLKDPEALCELKSLEILDVNLPEEFDVQQLTELKTLKYIDLAFDREEEARVLQQALPDCVVDYWHDGRKTEFITDGQQFRFMDKSAVHTDTWTVDALLEGDANSMKKESFNHPHYAYRAAHWVIKAPTEVNNLSPELKLKQKALLDWFITNIEGPKTLLRTYNEELFLYKGEPIYHVSGNELHAWHPQQFKKKRSEPRRFAPRIGSIDFWLRNMELEVNGEAWMIKESKYLYPTTYYTPPYSNLDRIAVYLSNEYKKVAIIGDQIVVTEFKVRLDLQKHLRKDPDFRDKMILDGYPPKIGGLNKNHYHYKDVAIKSTYSGTEFIFRTPTSDSSSRISQRPPWLYEEVHLIEFKNGKVSNRKDISGIMAGLRAKQLKSYYSRTQSIINDNNISFEEKIELLNQLSIPGQEESPEIREKYKDDLPF